MHRAPRSPNRIPRWLREIQSPGPEPESQADNRELPCILNYIINQDATIIFRIKRADGRVAGIKEEHLQQYRPDLVLEYWDLQQGREQATKLDMFHVFKILDSRVYEAKTQLKCQ
ncbi:hypothetical protein ACHAPA_012100 [Fusarium lateritium]